MSKEIEGRRGHPTEGQEPEAESSFCQIVDRKATRRIRAHSEREHWTWFGLGLFGLVGWAVALPTLIGLAIGYWIDRQFSGPVPWTLVLLLLGLTIGCLNAWRWIAEERRHCRPAQDTEPDESH